MASSAFFRRGARPEFLMAGAALGVKSICPIHHFSVLHLIGFMTIVAGLGQRFRLSGKVAFTTCTQVHIFSPGMVMAVLAGNAVAGRHYMGLMIKENFTRNRIKNDSKWCFRLFDGESGVADNCNEKKEGGNAVNEVQFFLGDHQRNDPFAKEGYSGTRFKQRHGLS